MVAKKTSAAAKKTSTKPRTSAPAKKAVTTKKSVPPARSRMQVLIYCMCGVIIGIALTVFSLQRDVVDQLLQRIGSSEQQTEEIVLLRQELLTLQERIQEGDGQWNLRSIGCTAEECLFEPEDAARHPVGIATITGYLDQDALGPFENLSQCIPFRVVGGSSYFLYTLQALAAGEAGVITHGDDGITIILNVAALPEARRDLLLYAQRFNPQSALVNVSLQQGECGGTVAVIH